MVREPQKITKAEVRAMLSRVEQASRAEDVEAVIGFMTDDVEISITARGPLGSTKKTMDRDEYERELRLGMALTEDYDFRTHVKSVTIAPDGLSAVVKVDIYEVVEMFGIKATSVSHETSLVQRRDGRLKFVKINAESEIQITPMPSQKRLPEGI